jgi:2-C-methyl-D-erythritol 4-phosphate cytidylyltransferase
MQQAGKAVGIVPVEGRGSLPFVLLRGEPLVVVASWALDEAAVELLDFDVAWADVQALGSALVIHDPLCPATPPEFLVRAIEAADGNVVVGVRPVTDTVKRVEDGAVGETIDRDGLFAVASPVVLPPAVVASLQDFPPLEDLAVLVDLLREAGDVTYLEAPAEARRVADESDVQLLQGLRD